MVSASAPDRSGGSTVGAGLRAFAAAVLLAGALTACNDDSPPDSRPGDGAALEVKLVSGTDDLDAQERSEVQNSVTDVLSKYVVEGFLGDYPREDFVQSFDSFTSGAARGAAGDIDLLTGARFAESEGVRATKLLAKISCLTDDDDVLGATAHVDFAFEVTDGKGAPQAVSLRGRFMLEEDDGDWSVFGYDVVRDDAERADS